MFMPNLYYYYIPFGCRTDQNEDLFAEKKGSSELYFFCEYSIPLKWKEIHDEISNDILVISGDLNTFSFRFSLHSQPQPFHVQFLL